MRAHFFGSLEVRTTLFTSTATIIMEQVNLADNRQNSLRVTNIALVVLAVAFVVLRFVSRRMKGLSTGSDDIFILVALVCILPTGWRSVSTDGCVVLALCRLRSLYDRDTLWHGKAHGSLDQ